MTEAGRRLLFVVNADWFFVSHRLALARAMVQRGYEVHLASGWTSDEAQRTIESARVKFHPLAINRSGTSPRVEFEAMLALFRLYRVVRPDIVHHVTIKPVIYGGCLARVMRVPRVVAAIPGLGYSFSRPGLKGWLIRKCLLGLYRLAFGYPHCRVIFQNVEQRDMFVKSRIVPEWRTVVIRGSGVDTREFLPNPEPVGRIRVMLAARMLREKGVREFMQAAAELKSRGVDAVFALVGDVDEHNPGSLDRATLRSWCDSGVVVWHGFSDQMAEEMAKCHIVCLPSYAEGLPKVLLEAAAAARPIVATDIPGCRDIARHGENALLVPPRDAHALADALEELIRDGELRRRFGRRGRDLVEREFSIERVIEQNAELYCEMLSVI